MLILVPYLVPVDLEVGGENMGFRDNFTTLILLLLPFRTESVFFGAVMDYACPEEQPDSRYS